MEEGDGYRLEWTDTKKLESSLSVKNRSMELSELVRYQGRLFAFCRFAATLAWEQLRKNGSKLIGQPKLGDITGIVFEIDLEAGQAIQRLVLSDGNGRSTKPFKSEWATVKDGILCSGQVAQLFFLHAQGFSRFSACAVLTPKPAACYYSHLDFMQDGQLLVGSMGREWVGDDGRIEHYNPQWVKEIDRTLHVESLDWRQKFEALRSTLGLRSPGYLWHEAVIWDSWLRRWIVLPRKASVNAYTPTEDETRGTNVLLLAAEDFSRIETLHIGPLEPEWGFAAVRKVPGTNDTYAALKALEVGPRTATKICVFNLAGEMLLNPPFVDVDEMKFEGLEFIHDFVG